MAEPAAPKLKKAADIFALHCLNSECRGLLAYEVDGDNVLYVDLAWTAKSDAGKRYFPCPKCGSKNIVEEFRTDKGQVKHKVTRWEP
jgi:DNA-directed RNA polymerase subunit RPC12/RpoP